MGSDNINDAAGAIDVSAVSDAIRAEYKLPELTDEQKQQRQLEMEVYRWEQQQRHEQERLAYRQRQAEAEASADEQRRVAQAEANRRARREHEQRISEQVRERELRDLRLKMTRAEWWQGSVEQAMRNQQALQYRNSLMGELEAMIAQPTPEPEEEPLTPEDAEAWRRIWGR